MALFVNGERKILRLNRSCDLFASAIIIFAVAGSLSFEKSYESQKWCQIHHCIDIYCGSLQSNLANGRPRHFDGDQFHITLKAHIFPFAINNATIGLVLITQFP